jgi:hypothetical protein
VLIGKDSVGNQSKAKVIGDTERRNVVERTLIWKVSEQVFHWRFDQCGERSAVHH